MLRHIVLSLALAATCAVAPIGNEARANIGGGGDPGPASELRLEPMQAAFYARHAGALVRKGPAISEIVIATLKENDPVRVIGKAVVRNPDDTRRSWYRLMLADGSEGFSAEDQVFSERALAEKKKYLQWIAQLDSALLKIRTEGTGPYRDRSGLWTGNADCKSFHEVGLIDHREIPTPNEGNSINDGMIEIFFSVVHFVYFNDLNVRIATALQPEKFRAGRLEHVMDAQGAPVYRSRMNDGGEAFAIGFRGPLFSMNGARILAEGTIRLVPACGSAQADDILGKLKRVLSHRIELIDAE